MVEYGSVGESPQSALFRVRFEPPHAIESRTQSTEHGFTLTRSQWNGAAPHTRSAHYPALALHGSVRGTMIAQLQRHTADQNSQFRM